MPPMFPASPAATTSPLTTAPRPSKCRQGTGRPAGCRGAGTAVSTTPTRMAAVTQIRYRHSDGRAYYDRKLAEGKTPKEALRCLKRRVSDAIYARLQAAARRAAAFDRTGGTGGQPGNDSVASAAGSHPENQLFGQATPEPATTLRPPAAPARTRPAPAPTKNRNGS